MQIDQFTALETQVLDRFFTKDYTAGPARVYAAKPAIPPAFWAFLTGAYSRSSVSMRRKFLDAFQDTEGDKYEEALLNLTEGNDSNLDKVVAKAENFLSKWAIDYSHASLKDSCTDRFAIEGVTIFGAKMIEAYPLGAYQEKSTRYANFSKVEFITDFLPKIMPEKYVDGDTKMSMDPTNALLVFNKCLDAYKQVFESAFNYFYNTLKIEDVMVRSRTAKAKAFDIARYMLPVSTPTSVGVTMPSRETEKLIAELLGLPFAEAQAIGEAIRAAGSEINPALLKHTAARSTIRARTAQYIDDYYYGIQYEGVEQHDLVKDILSYTRHEPNAATYVSNGVTLQTAPEDCATHPRWFSTASAFAERFSIQHVPLLNIADSLRKRGTDTLTKVLEAVLKDRGEHDPIPAGFNVGELVFTGVIDYGAYRDLQRHRRGYQQRIQPTQHFSWALPEFITDRADLLEVCDDALTAIGEVFYDTQFADDSGCEYFTLLCHNVQFTYVCDVAQLCYVAELRTAQAGHISYRTFVQDMARCALQAFPELEPYLRVDWSNDTDRRAQEESSVRKEKALRA